MVMSPRRLRKCMKTEMMEIISGPGPKSPLAEAHVSVYLLSLARGPGTMGPVPARPWVTDVEIIPENRPDSSPASRPPIFCSYPQTSPGGGGKAGTDL